MLFQTHINLFKPHNLDCFFYSDVISQFVACEELENYDKNGRAGKKRPITLIDPE